MTDVSMTSSERWRSVDGADLYEVSDLGRVRSRHRSTGSRGGGRNPVSPDRILRPAPQNRGYLQVVLVCGGERRTRTVHRLVAAAFVPNPLGLREINHIDGNKANNAAENLEWCTRSENLRHAFAAGLKVPPRTRVLACGAQQSDARALDDAQADQVRLRVAAGASKASVAREMGVSPKTIFNIVNRILYR